VLIQPRHNPDSRLQAHEALGKDDVASHRACDNPLVHLARRNGLRLNAGMKGGGIAILMDITARAAQAGLWAGAFRV
jgi:hypothetical protein